MRSGYNARNSYCNGKPPFIPPLKQWVFPAGLYNIYNTAGRKEPDIFAFLEANIDYSIRYDEKKYSAYTYWSEEEIEIEDEDGEVYRTELVYQHTSDIDIAKKTVPTAKSKRLK